MITPKLKNMFSVDFDIDEYRPEIPGCFRCQLWLDIGSEDSKGADMFILTVCSPAWLQRELREKDAIWGRHLLIIPDFDAHLIQEKVESYLKECQGNTWQEVAEKVARFAAWEFEDYQETVLTVDENDE